MTTAIFWVLLVSVSLLASKALECAINNILRKEL